MRIIDNWEDLKKPQKSAAKTCKMWKMLRDMEDTVKWAIVYLIRVLSGDYK